MSIFGNNEEAIEEQYYECFDNNLSYLLADTKNDSENSSDSSKAESKDEEAVEDSQLEAEGADVEKAESKDEEAVEDSQLETVDADLKDEKNNDDETSLTPEDLTHLSQQTNIYKSTYSDMRKDLPQFRSGDTLSVGYRVVEGERSRIQYFDGVVIKISAGHGLDKTFTVRKVSSGIGVERIFPLHSPNIDSIKVLKYGKVRRAKLYYLRDRVGKATRIKERN